MAVLSTPSLRVPRRMSFHRTVCRMNGVQEPDRVKACRVTWTQTGAREKIWYHHVEWSEGFLAPDELAGATDKRWREGLCRSHDE